MAKKKEAVEILGPELRHTNEQAVPAAATTGMAESVQNPYWNDSPDPDKATAMLVTRVVARMSAVTPMAMPASAWTWQSQIQYGDRAAVNAIVEWNSQFLFSCALVQMSFSSAVGSQLSNLSGFDHDLIRPTPILMLDKYTIVHDWSAAHAQINNKVVYTDVYYHKVRLDDSIAANLLRAQTRIS
ncbi:unnamed protein product [marine sediment metagenome]|uniref:Uncharacterized protein n=1 Tax=marine sediment metagenome TaxID=412755 RepID=X1DNC1_9ZZZZ